MSRGSDSHPRELLSSYLDGEVPEGARLEAERHLAACPECRDWLSDLRILAEAARGEVPPPAPADLRRRISASLYGAPATGRLISGRWFVTHRLGLAAAGIVLILGVLTLRLDLNSSGSRPPAPAAPNESADSARKENAPATSPPPVDRPTSLQTPGRSPGVSRSDALRDKARAESKGPAVPLFEAGGVRKQETAEGSAAAAAAAPQPLSPAAGAKDAEERAGRRPLQFEFPTFALSVSEDGTVALSAAGYSCRARLAGSSVDPDIASLFAMAERRAAGSSYAPSPSPDAEAAPAGRAAAPREEAESAGDSRKRSEAPAGEEMRQRAKRLLLERYLSLMEERCGPAPRAVRVP